ncbi:Citrate transporter [[Clostridium] ultunense Esp]|nr:Citrate transporter [[Clostridium] ultunense Esp]
MIKIFGLIIAIGILAVLAYKGVGALPLTLLAAFVVIVTNQMNLWESYSEFYMNGFIGFLKSYFLIFATSSLYAKIMEDSGSAVAIGYKLIDWFGKDKAMLIVLLATSILTYGGISLFVVVFAVSPIIMLLFKESDIPRRLAMGPLLAGSATYTMTVLPGSSQLTNVVPTHYLGTTLTAAPVFSIIIAIIMFAMVYAYLKWEEKRLKGLGEHFSYIEGADPKMYEIDRSQLPSATKSFIPLLIVIGMIIGLRNVMSSSASVVLAMSIATIVALILNWDRIENKKETINTGLSQSMGAIIGPCAIVAFGGVIQNSPAFQDVIAWINGFNMNPYVTGVTTTAIIAGITGSSSAGLRITMETFADKFLQSGANMEYLHRVTSIAAGSLDTLPHSPGLFLMFSWLGLTHKEGYRFVFVTTVIIPLILTIASLAVITALGI